MSNEIIAPLHERDVKVATVRRKNPLLTVAVAQVGEEGVDGEDTGLHSDLLEAAALAVEES